MSLKSISWMALIAAALAAEIPLTVSDIAPGTPGKVRLTNTSRLPVTAWSLATTQSSDGRTHREVHTTDGYLSEATHGIPGASAALERLMPGESRQVAVDPLPPGASVEAIAAVLDDGTAIGDEQALSAIFARRAKERDALAAVVAAFKDVLPAKHGAEALAELRQRFTALVQREDAVPCRAALDAVQAYQQKANAEEIDRSLQTYASFVAREYDLAERHSHRRN